MPGLRRRKDSNWDSMMARQSSSGSFHADGGGDGRLTTSVGVPVRASLNIRDNLRAREVEHYFG